MIRDGIAHDPPRQSNGSVAIVNLGTVIYF
jgi:hypothetical protein